jgi:hypothetical protein
MCASLVRWGVHLSLCISALSPSRITLTSQLGSWRGQKKSTRIFAEALAAPCAAAIRAVVLERDNGTGSMHATNLSMLDP